MKTLFDTVSARCSKLVTRSYSTSFSLGIYCLNARLHKPIYGIYGFVRLADEIVDSFHDYDKACLLAEFENETWAAIDRGISLNPVLNSFQEVVHRYGIERELIHCFLQSMEMDLHKRDFNSESYSRYILGSAEVVGLMCLRVFTEGNEQEYERLRPAAMRLGASFQKVNFLRDIRDDFGVLGRIYFPGLNMDEFSEEKKAQISVEIERDFHEARKGILALPRSSRFGVYVAYVYYRSLFSKIRSLPSSRIMSERIRIPNYQKLGLLAGSYLRHSLKIL